MSKVLIDSEVLEQALEALIYCEAPDSSSEEQRFQAAIALRAALEQPKQNECICNQGQVCGVCDPIFQPQGEQEPVAWIWAEWSSRKLTFDGPPAVPSVRDELTKPVWTPLYTHPQPAQKPLTDEEILKAVRHLYHSDLPVGMGFSDDLDVARAIEAAHNIKDES